MRRTTEDRAKLGRNRAKRIQAERRIRARGSKERRSIEALGNKEGQGTFPSIAKGMNEKSEERCFSKFPTKFVRA
jgi:hypothetical protein